MRDRMDMAGRLTIVMHDRAGRLALQRTHPNLIVTSGRQLVADMFRGAVIGGAAPKPVSSLAIGTGAAPPQDGDTALVALRARKALAAVEPSTFTDPDGVARVRIRATTQFDFGEANDPSTPLREAGLFTAADVLYSRVVFKDVTKTDTFQLTMIWEIVF